MFDLIILGGGPGGYTSALKAAKKGLKVALIEKDDNLGGVCLNRGCIPTKSLLKSSSTYYNSTKGELYGIKADNISYDISKIIQRSHQISSDMGRGISFLMKKNNIEIFHGFGRLISSDKVEVKSEDNTDIIEGRNIILATGARPRHFDSIPVDGKYILDSNGALNIDHVPNSIAIVGSGAIGSEFATFFAQLGSKVTLIEYLNHIVPTEDDEISSTLERSMRKLGIKTLVSTAVKNVQIIDEHCVIEIENSKGTGTIETDIVLSAVGIAANIEGIGLEELGIITERNKIIVNDFFQTNIPNIYAIGDIIPTIALAHVATKEGEIAVSHILGMPTEKIDYSTIPACIFTSPEVASVGLRERQCTEKGINIKIGRFSYMASGKAASSGMKDGLVKLIFKEDDHKLIGAHLMGADVVEMIGECTLAISNGLTAEDIADIIHAHPTMHEAIMEAASVAFE